MHLQGGSGFLIPGQGALRCQGHAGRSASAAGALCSIPLPRSLPSQLRSPSEPEEPSLSPQHPDIIFIFPKSWKSCTYCFLPCKSKTEPPSKSFPSELGSALGKGSSQTEQHLQLGAGHRAGGRCPIEDQAHPSSWMLPALCPTRGHSVPCPAPCIKKKKKKPPFLSRSARFVPFSGLNFRRHQRAAESWWEPSSRLGREKNKIKPKQCNKRHIIAPEAHRNHQGSTCLLPTPPPGTD